MKPNKIKEKVLEEAEKKIGVKIKKGSVYRVFLLDGVDLTLVEVGKVIDKRKCCFKDIKDYRELKKELGLK